MYIKDLQLKMFQCSISLLTRLNNKYSESIFEINISSFIQLEFRSLTNGLIYITIFLGVEWKFERIICLSSAYLILCYHKQSRIIYIITL